ncbi:M50 family metallopeptidase [Paractinoplanes lichenicola]|uniref:Site-2 protease family protein n=1 Tax=Paractinoplanes lichenicola TaxID=2802976 RepID=A0ABS1VUD8_9ACTN|nr:site-2 protease family protein [Actinoplanes lichenicola]MBL7258107.1 site-2 protease family protein [Actinoplanes lichenicola]
MAYISGTLLFLIGICLSLAWHEAGHMLAARAFGMKVRRFFVGRGPTVFSFRRGETEYGLKALPIGGFCDIAGLTSLDELTPDEQPRAMWRYPTWKRTTVMLAGPVMHVILAGAILYAMALTVGLPNLRPVTEPVVASTSCVGAVCPAAEAGLREGDRIESVGGTPTPRWADVLTTVRAADGPTALVVRRGGETLTLTVDIAQGRMGASPQPPPAYVEGGLPETVAFTGDLLKSSISQLAAFPERIPAVIKAIGGEREADTPISMVGASRLGGEAVERGLWATFVLLLVSLNLFLAVFNLLPLLPLDGGHIAVVWFERVRDFVRRLRGRPAGGPVDFTRLFPATMVLIVIGGAVMALTITADIVNPIRLQ